MRRRWQIVVLVLLAATLTNCGQAVNGTGQPEAPMNHQQHDPVQSSTQPPQQGSD